MTAYNTTQLAGMASQPFQLPTAENGYGARSVKYLTSITFASQASGSTINGPVIPKGKIVESITTIVDTSTGSATLQIGNATSAGKYRAAAAQTTISTPTSTIVTLVDPPVASTAEEQIIVTTGGASLPASGIMWLIANCLSI